MQEEIGSYTIEKILEEEIIEGKPHYLIKWNGFSATQSTWEPIQNLIDAIDIIHQWKLDKLSHIRKSRRTPTKQKIKKTKKINHQTKGHVQSNNRIQKKLNSNRKTKKIQKDSFLVQEQSTNMGSTPSQCHHLLKNQQLSSSSSMPPYPQSKIQLIRNSKLRQQMSNSNIDLQSIDYVKPRKRIKKKTREQYFSKFNDSVSGSERLEQVDGFKVVGKITRDGVSRVLWCFDWQGQKICEVELVNGKKANMRREDVQRICPDKLCEYLQKIVDYKQ